MDTYRVTRHQGSTGTLLYSTPREDLGLCVYGMLRPLRGMCISLWTPTGELMASNPNYS